MVVQKVRTLPKHGLQPPTSKKLSTHNSILQCKQFHCMYTVYDMQCGKFGIPHDQTSLVPRPHPAFRRWQAVFDFSFARGESLGMRL